MPPNESTRNYSNVVAGSSPTSTASRSPRPLIFIVRPPRPKDRWNSKWSKYPKPRTLYPNHNTAMTMKYAICNETFEGWDHERVCRFAAETGYTGLEIAPFTLAPLHHRCAAPSAGRNCGSRPKSHGVSIIGLHWLLAKTQGLHAHVARCGRAQADGRTI